MPAPSDDSSLHRLVRLVCVLFAATSFPLAVWMLISPDAFWSSLGVGGNPFAEAIYGGAIAGEGVMFLLGARRPERYRVFFEYMVAYKSLAVLGGLGAFLASDTRPLGALFVLSGWASAGVIAAIVVVRGAHERSGDAAVGLAES